MPLYTLLVELEHFLSISQWKWRHGRGVNVCASAWHGRRVIEKHKIVQYVSTKREEEHDELWKSKVDQQPFIFLCISQSYRMNLELLTASASLEIRDTPISWAIQVAAITFIQGMKHHLVAYGDRKEDFPCFEGREAWRVATCLEIGNESMKKCRSTSSIAYYKNRSIDRLALPVREEPIIQEEPQVIPKTQAHYRRRNDSEDQRSLRATQGKMRRRD